MEYLLKCKGVTKEYNSRTVLKNFSYSFLEKGLYTIYGDSGIGKTTLLNIINGLIPFEKGEVLIYDNVYRKKVNSNFTNQTIAYITQNKFFIDYLNVYDNLKLCLDNQKNRNKIDILLKKVELLSKKYCYPKDLSGGELQRLSLVVALLQEKQIIILDEPTASLDEENAKLLISILKEIKKNHLIICATHDKLLIDESDEMIDLNNFNSTKDEKSSNGMKKYIKNNAKKRLLLFPFMLKKNKKFKTNKSSIILIIILTISLLIFNLCYDSEAKIQQTLLDYNKINFVNYECDAKVKDHCESILNKYNVIKNTYLYSNNIPYETYGEPILLSAQTLPFDKNLFTKFDDYIWYGGYYENENDIIIGYEYAMGISSNIEELIGTNINIKMPDKTDSFRIVGIFKNIEDDAYMRALAEGIDYLNEEIYLNDKYIEKYEYDGIPKMFEVQNGVISMRAYFDNSNDLKAFYDDTNPNITIKNFDSYFISFGFLISAFDYYLKPALIVSFIISLIFYYEIENLYNKKKSYILSIYKYYGYSYLQIALGYIISSIIYICFLFSLAFILSLILSNGLNYMFLEYKISSFKLFLIDYSSAIKLFKYLILISILLIIPIIITQFRKGWLKTIKESEDFI